MMKNKKKKKKKMMYEHPNENAKIVKGRVSVVLRGRDLKFWERGEKNNILMKRNFRRDGRS